MTSALTISASGSGESWQTLAAIAHTSAAVDAATSLSGRRVVGCDHVVLRGAAL